MAEKKYPAEDHRKFHAWKWEERHAALYSALVGMFVGWKGATPPTRQCGGCETLTPTRASGEIIFSVPCQLAQVTSSHKGAYSMEKSYLSPRTTISVGRQHYEFLRSQTHKGKEFQVPAGPPECSDEHHTHHVQHPRNTTGRPFMTKTSHRSQSLPVRTVVDMELPLHIII